MSGHAKAFGLASGSCITTVSKWGSASDREARRHARPLACWSRHWERMPESRVGAQNVPVLLPFDGFDDDGWGRKTSEERGRFAGGAEDERRRRLVRRTAHLETPQ